MASDAAEILRGIEDLDGGKLDHWEQRRILLDVGLGAVVDRPADYAVFTGCHAPFLVAPTRSFIDLLNYWQVGYTLLSKELCCGHPMLRSALQQLPTHDASGPRYERYSRQWLEENLAQARTLGAKGIITLCPGCNSMLHRHSGHQGPEIMHYLDFILKMFDGARLAAEIDFFEGCHTLHNWTPDFQESMIGNSREVLARVEGLVATSISPKTCCRLAPRKVFSSSRTGIIVTPTLCCYLYLSQSRQPGDPAVRYLGEIIVQALAGTGH